jgi:hypothetical protein
MRVFAEFHGKLIERIGSARELGEFLTTDAGARFLDSLAMERSTPQARILRAMQSGLVLLCLGLGLFTFLWWSPTLPAPVWDTVMLLATIVSALGIGFILSAGASYVLSQRMGILVSPDRTRQPGSTVSA